MKKKNVKIGNKNNIVIFDFIGKDGIPIKIEHKFNDIYISKLSQILENKTDENFIFIKNNSTLSEHDFKTAFKKYCGLDFIRI